ncbi:MAG: phosphotransferase [Planctomycetota bacterium]
MADERDVRALPFFDRPVEVQPLSGGLTNQNFRATTRDGRAFAVRFGTDDPVLGIDRRNEIACTRAAAELGIAPEILWCSDGAMVAEFVAGGPMEPTTVAANVARIAAVLRRIHDAGPMVTGHLSWFSPFLVARTYVRFARDRGLPLPGGAGADGLLGEVAALEARMAPFVPTFCHNDLMPGNLMDDGQRIAVIDWEYAGFGHPLFDLAGLSSNCELTAEQDRELLRCHGDDGDAAHGQFLVLKAMAALRESLWAVLQIALSEIEFEYDAYRDDNHRKYVAYRDALP